VSGQKPVIMDTLIYVGSWTTGISSTASDIVMSNVTIEGATTSLSVAGNLMTVDNCTFSNGTTGVSITSGQNNPRTITRCVFDQLTNGVAHTTGVSNNATYMRENAFRNVTNRITVGSIPIIDRSGDITVASAPFADSDSGDFRPNTTADGGALLRGKSYAFTASGATSYAVGAMQPEASTTVIVVTED
jgi:hypothetical protein